MQSRLIFTTPAGPACFIDYATIERGASIFEEIRIAAANIYTARRYEFGLFEKTSFKLIKTQWLYMPFFNIACVKIFLDSADLNAELFPV